MRNIFRVVVLIFLPLIILSLTGCGGTSYDRNVRLVREGSLQMNPTVPIGKAFDQFFINDSWKSFTSTENEQIVEFNGDCNLLDVPVTVKIQFLITGNSFNVKYVGIDDVPMDGLDGLSVLDKVLSEYRP